MNFVAPSVLYLIPVLLPLVAWFLWWTWRKRQSLIRQFISERLLSQLLEGVSPSRQKLRLVLLALSILFLLLALARPQWGFVWEEASQRGRDILVAIDTSKSMLATDMAPNRLERAKLAALDLLRLAKNDRLGLIAFAGGAFLQSPLTLDDEAFRQNINALDTSIIPQGGTSLSEAIDAAISSFASEEGDNHRVLIIFTDGEDQDQGALQAVEKAAEKNLKIFTVGVGTPAGELIRVTDQNGQTSFIKDGNGNAVKSRLNEDLLRQIATAGNGFYLALREGNAMQTLYQKGLEPMPTSEISSKLVRHLNEQFHWPLGIAVAFLLMEMLLPPAPKKRARATQLALILILLTPAPTQASPARAYRDYKSGQYKDARNEYERLLEKKPDDPILNYNAGAASYKAGAYDAAVKQFSAASRAQDLNLQQSAYYNLGNANFRLGNEETDPQKKMGIWQQALQNFESSLKLNSKDADATFNHDLVKQRLEELKKQQEQQKNQDQKKDDKQDKQQDQDNKQQDKNKNEEQKKDQQKNDNKKDDQQQQDQKDNEQQKSDQQKKDEEKKKQEQQQQQQQGKDGQDKKDAQQKDQQQQQQANKDEHDPQKEAEQEARAAQLGQMTPKQAQQMLDAQKTDERALIYRQPLERRRAREKSLNDW